MYKSYNELSNTEEKNIEQYNVRELQNLGELTALVSNTRFVVVDIYADWCQPCKMTAPIYASMAKRFHNSRDIAIVKLRFENIEMPARRAVTGIPLFEFYFEGKKIDQVVGGDIEAVEQKLNEISAKIRPSQYSEMSPPTQFSKSSIRNNRNTIPDTYFPPTPGGPSQDRNNYYRYTN